MENEYFMQGFQAFIFQNKFIFEFSVLMNFLKYPSICLVDSYPLITRFEMLLLTATLIRKKGMVVNVFMFALHGLEHDIWNRIHI